MRPSVEKAVGHVHVELDALQTDRKADLADLASQALADDTGAQFDAWAAAGDEKSLTLFGYLIQRWCRAGAERALGNMHADLDMLRAKYKADLDALLAA